MKKKTIGFIGCGNIANAIIEGSVNSGYIKSENLYLYDTDISKIQPFSDKGFNLSGSACELVRCCDFVFLTVKPQVYDLVIDEIKSVSKETCFIAVAAGVTIRHIKERFGFDAPVIRVMPNTPLMYSEGATAMVKASPVSDEQFSFIKNIFAYCGVVEEADEDKINLITAISGSAPAYVMSFARVFIDYAVSNGLNIETAKSLVLQAISGTAQMVKISDSDIDILIKNVTSPNGTTEAGLKSLKADCFDTVIKNCLDATVKRATELTR